MDPNPFSALLTNPEPMITSSPSPSDMLTCKSSDDDDDDDEAFNGIRTSTINSIVENVFLITLNGDMVPSQSSSPSQWVYMEDWAMAISPRTKFNTEILEQALFDRLLLENPADFVVPKGALSADAVEKNVLAYLFGADQRLQPYARSNDEVVAGCYAEVKALIVRNAVTALKQPELFDGQNLHHQMFQILKFNEASSHSFFLDIINGFMTGEGDDLLQLSTLVNAILKAIHGDVAKSKVVTLELYIFPVLYMFTTNTQLAPLFLEYCQPHRPDFGKSYLQTLLGSLLNLSVLPKSADDKYEYFENPMDKAENTALQSALWRANEHLIISLHKLFMNLLKLSAHTKNRLLEWIGNCLHANAARGKMWTTTASRSCVPDGFMLNLSVVLLMLSQPFCNNAKCFNIDPTYCAVEDDNRHSKNVHMKGMTQETCIIPPREVTEGSSAPARVTADTYNFVTECFFMTHKSLDLGYRTIVEKLIKISQDLSHIRQALADTTSDSPFELADVLDKRIKSYTTKLLCLRCALCQPQTVSLLSNFHSTTCVWLVQLAIHRENGDPKTSYAPLKEMPLVFPLDDEEPEGLRCVPECVVENVFEFMSTTRHLRPFSPDEQITNLMRPLLSLVLVFMGNSKKMRNPHLRARLAECLATLIPRDEQEELPMSPFSVSIREQLFTMHPHRLQIIPSLLNVFVGIEVTGEGVSFEQKFHYRRPMYIILEYLWELEEHRECMRRLSQEAEANMEAVNPPIFLRFINLLMNDAVFLLDEALNNMTQIRNMQTISQSELAQRPAQEREEHYMNLRHTGMIARFDNILGRHTIVTLERITSETKSIFCHPTMVDRVAAMLNYFLLHLVGPNRKNFKVKDSDEFEFDPVATVLDICRIYIHLGENQKFCLAISHDGRSYSPKLFELAEGVLARIQGGGELISSLRELAAKVSESAARQLEDEEIFADTPEEFLDPIMSTIMMDPVVLPSSKINIDRTTIARHLLSDQSDPFNRSPLNMDQVKTNVELKTKIAEWIEVKRKEYRAKKESTEQN